MTEVCPVGAPTYSGATGQVDKWTNWTAYRITTDYRVWAYQLFKDYDSVIGHEVSSKGVKHFHVIVPGPKKDSISKAIQRKFENKSGPKLWNSIVFPNPKKPEHTFEKGVMYTTKCGDCEYYGAMTKELCDSYGKWEFPERGTKRQGFLGDTEDKKDRDWQLNYSNVVCQAVRHARRTNCGGGFYEVVKDMLRKTKWRPSREMYKNGLPLVYSNDFEFRLGRDKDLKWDWMQPNGS